MIETDQAQDELFTKAWCPLLGKLPTIPYNPSDLTSRCKQIIESARELWGVNDAWLNVLESSWPDPSKIDDYPANYIVSARILYGAWLQECNRAEHKFEKHDNPEMNETEYEYAYDIPNYFRNADIDLEQEKIDILNQFRKFHDKHLIDDNLQLPHACAIRAIKITWIALGEIILRDQLNDDPESVYKKILSAESLLSFAKDWIMEPIIEAGKKVIEAGRRGGQAKGKSEKIKDRHTEWQKLADQLWKKKPNISRSMVAMVIAKKTGDNPNTIRRVIKNNW